MSVDPDIDWARETDDLVQQSRRAAGYAELFGSPLGRVVLADILRTAGVGAPKGPPTAVPGLRDYEAGREDNALEIADLAATPQSAVVQQVIEDQEGYYHDRAEF